MQTLVVVIVLGVIVGAIAWIVVVLRRFGARKRLEQEREARFLAEMRRAPPAPAAAAVTKAAAPPAMAAAAVAQAPVPTDPIAKAAFDIRNALAAGRGEAAARTFFAVVGERTKLTLEPPIWEGLGRALLAQGAFMEAAWALHAAAALAGDLAAAQKRLVEVATRAGDAGQAHNALKLYATLLAKYPQSQYATRADQHEGAGAQAAQDRPLEVRVQPAGVEDPGGIERRLQLAVDAVSARRPAARRRPPTCRRRGTASRGRRRARRGSRIAARVGAALRSQRSAPPHSTSCVAVERERRRRRRHRQPPQRRARRAKNWSVLVAQPRPERAACARRRGSPPSVARAASHRGRARPTGARASTPSHQALARDRQRLAGPVG